MKLITWNIQWGCGVDERVDLDRIVRTAREMSDFDVICFQEVETRSLRSTLAFRVDNQVQIESEIKKEKAAPSKVTPDFFI